MSFYKIKSATHGAEQQVLKLEQQKVLWQFECFEDSSVLSCFDFWFCCQFVFVFLSCLVSQVFLWITVIMKTQLQTRDLYIFCCLNLLQISSFSYIFCLFVFKAVLSCRSVSRPRVSEAAAVPFCFLRLSVWNHSVLSSRVSASWWRPAVDVRVFHRFVTRKNIHPAP